MADYKECKDGITICTKAGEFSTQRGCIFFIENERLKKCVFEKWGWVCDCTTQTHNNVVSFNKRRTE